MYHVVLRNGEHDSYTHPAISQVENGERQVWQTNSEGDPTLMASYPQTDVYATVDCLHEEEFCEDLQGVLDRVHAPAPAPVAERVRRKFAALGKKDQVQ
jgi:hypothetical protein